MTDNLFSRIGMGEYMEEFKNLPEELRGIDLEPDPLPPINIESELSNGEFIQVNYGAHHAKDVIDLVGFNFIRSGKNSVMFDSLRKRENLPTNVWDNESDDYFVVIFDKADKDEVVRMFNLPGYVHQNVYRLEDLLNAATFKFD